MTEPNAPVEIFISYAHKDESFKDDLVEHLAVLRKTGVISDWNDRDIDAGAEWEEAINENLEKAQLILLLVSPSFLASRYCWSIEMERALARHASGSARVIPIILRPCDWSEAPISKLQALPRDGKPISTSKNRDAAYTEVVTHIRKVLGKPPPKAMRR
jgi:hypothetical protein